MDPKRCGACSKKLGIVSTFSCKCENNYCSMHRMPEYHNCSKIDIFKQDGISRLEKTLIKVVAQKIPVF
jgi:hypothetical protein